MKRSLWIALAVGYPLLVYASVRPGAALLDDARVLLLLPVGINAALLFAFGRTLRNGSSMAESFARLRFAELSQQEIRYCRTVTVVWCGFFAVNGAVAAWLALAGALEAWAFYTGLLAYLALGLLYTVEFVYRHWRFRRYGGAFTDPLLRWIFPPRSSTRRRS